MVMNSNYDSGHDLPDLDYEYVIYTTRTLMWYIAYDTPTSKCLCLSIILKIKAILAK